MKIKGYDVIILVHNVTNKILLCDSIYTVDMVMWPEIGNFSIAMIEVIFNFIKIGPEKPLFWGVVLVQVQYFGRLALGISLKFYTIMAKGLKLKVRKILGLIFAFVELTGEKLIVRLFAHPPSQIGLNCLYLWLWQWSTISSMVYWLHLENSDICGMLYRLLSFCLKTSFMMGGNIFLLIRNISIARY